MAYLRKKRFMAVTFDRSRRFSYSRIVPSPKNSVPVVNVTVYARNAAVEAAPLKDESVLFHPATNRFCMLNKTMAFIWSKLEHRSTVDEISDEITRNFAGVTDGEARNDV